MPRPVFIICSESAAIDKLTNFASIFDIFEKVNFRRASAGEVGEAAAMFKMAIVSTWMRADDEGDNLKFEQEFALIIPPNGREIVVAKGLFSFSSGKQFFRSVAKMNSPMPIEGAGILEVVNRVRLVGADQWVSQSYPVIMEELPEPDEAAPAKLPD